MKLHIYSLAILAIMCACKKKSSHADGESEEAPGSSGVVEGSELATKLTSADCIDPDLSDLANGAQITLCNGEIGVGTQAVPVLPNPDPWDVRFGVTVGATTGKLKMNCRNMVGHYDGAAHTGGSTTLHTIEDKNYTGAVAGDFPSFNPWSSDAYYCGYNDPSDPTWERVTTTPPTSGENSVFKDKISGLFWSRGTVTSTKDWDEASGGGGNGAMEYCNTLDHGGITAGNWRLPTQREMMAAYQHGIHDLDDDHTLTDHLGDLDDNFWTSTNKSDNTLQARFLNLDSTSATFNSKTLSVSVVCVSS